MHAAKSEAGLVVVGVTDEAAEEVEAYVGKNKVEHPVSVAVAEGYDVLGIPDAFLIDKEGKIRWRGHPGILDSVLLDKILIGAKPAVVVKGMEAVWGLRRQGNHGAAYSQSSELLQAGGLSERAAAQAKEWMAASEQFVTESMAAADAAEAGKDIYLLWSKLDPVANHYAGVPGAAPAKVRRDELMAQAKHKREVEAGIKLAEGKSLEAAMKFEAAHTIYRALAISHGGTKAGKVANTSYRALEKDGKIGYDLSCGFCKALGAACAQHRKKKK